MLREQPPRLDILILAFNLSVMEQGFAILTWWGLSHNSRVEFPIAFLARNRDTYACTRVTLCLRNILIYGFGQQILQVLVLQVLANK